jgi:hypothetical protein
MLPVSDPFLLTSCLQKSLRRADAGYAHGAAQAFLALDPRRLWRRLVICAVEDFGLSDLRLTSQIIAAASDRAWRRRNGGDQHVLSYLMVRLLQCPRDRRVDELYMLSVSLSRSNTPEVSIERPGASERLAELLREAVALVHRCEQVVAYRGIRAVIAAPCDAAIAEMGRRGLADPGVEEACIQARRTTQCLLPVLLPLLKGATEEAGGHAGIVERMPPEVRDIEGLPSYCPDGFTRPGRAALMTLARQDRRLAKLLAPLATAKARMDALVNLLFVVEGGVCTVELSDPLYDELKRHSQGCWAGLPKLALLEGLAIMSDAIPILNDIRSDLVTSPIWQS